MKNKKINTFIFVFRIISLIIVIICLYVLYWWYVDNQKNNTLKQDLSKFIVSKKQEENPENPYIPKYTKATDEIGAYVEQFQVTFDDLLEQNPDSVGWIRVLDTNISYPIVQTTDNDYYLTHNINLEKNGAGWIYADYRNNFETLDRNTIIYGHNRRNGTMFSNLQYYLNEDFYKDPNHKYINFNTINQAYLAEVFAVYMMKPEDVDLKNDYPTDAEFFSDVGFWKANSVYNFNVDINSNDKILTLFTCDDDTTYRILVHAKLVPLN